MTSQWLKVVLERHAVGYVAYPLGIHGVVVGQGDTYEEAMEDVRSAIDFHRDALALIRSNRMILWMRSSWRKPCWPADAGIAYPSLRTP